MAFVSIHITVYRYSYAECFINTSIRTMPGEKGSKKNIIINITPSWRSKPRRHHRQLPPLRSLPLKLQPISCNLKRPQLNIHFHSSALRAIYLQIFLVIFKRIALVHSLNRKLRLNDSTALASQGVVYTEDNALASPLGQLAPGNIFIIFTALNCVED